MTIFEIFYDWAKRTSDKDEERKQRVAQILLDIGAQLSEAARLLAELELYDATEARRSIQEYAKQLPGLLSDELSDEELRALIESLNAVNIPPSTRTASSVVDPDYSQYILEMDQSLFQESSWKDFGFRTAYAMQLKEAAGVCKAIGRLLMAR